MIASLATLGWRAGGYRLPQRWKLAPAGYVIVISLISLVAALKSREMSRVALD